MFLKVETLASNRSLQGSFPVFLSFRFVKSVSFLSICLGTFLFHSLLLSHHSYAANSVRGETCRNKGGIGVSRILEIDTSTGPRYGRVQFKDQLLPLKPKEVVITFDDGPLPSVTKSILRTLKRHCTKATFFAVGKMAKAYPQIIQRVAREGHTVGAHTHSHPRDLRHHYFPYSRFQIERGFQDVQAATGHPIAPFFRFPGLHDYKEMNDYLSDRHIANFSVDIVPGDTSGYSPARIIRNTLSQLRRRGKGILLLHDIKPATAAALPRLLSALKERGYKIVHIVPKKPFKSVPIALMNMLYEDFSHKDPKTIIGGLTYRQLYGGKSTKKAKRIYKKRLRKYRGKRYSKRVYGRKRRY